MERRSETPRVLTTGLQRLFSHDLKESLAEASGIGIIIAHTISDTL